MRWLWLLVCLLFASHSHAQTARAFYNVTGIKTKKLSNAVQITIQTDGDVVFGNDYADMYTVTSDGDFFLKPITSIRLRLIGARTRLPSFNNIGSYPVDSGVISIGVEPFKYPNFNDEQGLNDPDVPKLDIELRMYIPLTRVAFASEDGPGRNLRPLQARVELTPDRRAIQITVITDRVETDRLEKRMDRSPAAERKQALSIEPQRNGKVTVRALHAPLSELVPKLAEAMGTPLAVQSDAAETQVSLNLKDASLPEILHALELGAGIGIAPEGAGFLLGRSGAVSTTEQIPLKNLDARTARLLLPDFLLPTIRADLELNALVVTNTPAIVRRIRADIAQLDTPRRQVRIRARAYELEVSTEERAALLATYATNGTAATLNPETSTLSLALKESEMARLTLSLDALSARGKARLLSQPEIAVASGATGTLFAGQQRLINVASLYQGEILKLQVGATLSVTPQLSAGGEILLDLLPRFASVVALEAGTRLPTIGVRESASHLRIRPGDTVLVASLDANLSDSRQRAPLPRRSISSQHTSYLLLVTAEPIP